MALITGTAIGPDGAAVVGATISFELQVPELMPSGSNTVFPARVNTITGAAGAISVTLNAGRYISTYTTESGYTSEFGFLVPAGANATFNSCIVELVHS